MNLARFASLAFPAAALAQSVPVVNPSFESPVQAPNGFTSPPTAVPGWSLVSGSGPWGVFYPTAGTWGYTTSLGNQLLYTNGPTVEQTLTTNAAIGAYTLQVDVINRPNYGVNYFIEFYAGAALLARDNNSVHPASGASATSTLIGVIPAGSVGIGQPLRIRLGGSSQQSNFDNIRVTIGACYPNCDSSTVAPILNVNDFTCFLNKFSAADPYANCDGSTTPPVLNVNDFTCFLNRFVAGCS
jgi:hypothetical protein